MGSSEISKAAQAKRQTGGLPTQIPTGLMKAYPADKLPGIKKWFQQMFPSLQGKQLDQAVSQFMLIQMQFMEHFMTQLRRQQKEAMRQLRESEEEQA